MSFNIASKQRVWKLPASNEFAQVNSISAFAKFALIDLNEAFGLPRIGL